MESPEIAQHYGESNFSVSDSIIELSGVRDKEIELCKTPAAQENSDVAKQVSNQTSDLNSDPDDRAAAAKAAWNLSSERVEIMRDWACLPPTTWLDKYGYAKDGGYTVTAIFPGGGTEQYKFRIQSGNGDLARIVGTLKPGTGLSACPK